MRPSLGNLSLGDCVALACLLEATAPKAGNVHRGADFADMCFTDFLVSSVALRGVFDGVASAGVGEIIAQATNATRCLVPVNTNLGLVLLLAPLAKAATRGGMRSHIGEVLRTLTPADSAGVYQAIARAAPGGMGEVEQMDVAHQPPEDLLAAMQAAAHRDLIARQYVSDFADVFALVADPLAQTVAAGHTLTAAIIDTHLRLMSQRPDSLIGRKCGEPTAGQAALLAGRVMNAGPIDSEPYLLALADLDFWLRSDGHRRNPGTSADLLGAGLFVALWEGTIGPPFR